MPDWGTLFLLMAAIAVGYFLGRRGWSSAPEAKESLLQPHYIQGLNYLLSEQPDAAIDNFIDALEVNNETLETHLAMGNLLRKRGEVDRAIKIHQNLMSRPRLGEEQSLLVQLELARDFIQAGLLDRAELLLLELMDSGTASMRNQCLQYLIEIYRDEKEWQKGISAINQLAGKRFARLEESWRLVQAHYYCEMAEEALQRSDYLVARRHLKSAIGADKQSVRASLLYGRLEMLLGQYNEALTALKQVFHQDPSLLAESIPMIRESYVHLEAMTDFADYLDTLLEQSGAPVVALARAELIAGQEGTQMAAEFLGRHREANQSLQVARQMLRYQLAHQPEPDKTVKMTESVIDKLLQAIPRYRCGQCGFGGQQMHWLCPGCKSWGSVKPVD